MSAFFSMYSFAGNSLVKRAPQLKEESVGTILGLVNVPVSISYKIAKPRESRPAPFCNTNAQNGCVFSSLVIKWV